MKRLRRLFCPMIAFCLLGSSGETPAEVYNLKVVTDASPDYSDMASMVHSIASKWASPEEKCWAMFYWNHIARRQTSPMILHGLELTDPIRQFNDYGYTMCSTISGINCAIWRHMGLPSKFWDISLHTVSEVFYDDRWHVYDNSMSALYTLCDGRTIAGVEDVGKEGSCSASEGVSERGHIAKYHCLYATGPHGFLTGADTQRSLEEESRCFNPNALKYRNYYYNWDYGHRFILNLRPHETYTRHYHSLGPSPEFYVPNHGKDPDERYHLRGNGVWQFQPSLDAVDCLGEIHSAKNIISEKGRLQPSEPGKLAEVVYKIQGANVITSQEIEAGFICRALNALARIELSTNNGLSWISIWSSSERGETSAQIKNIKEVNGAYEVLIKVVLSAQTAASDIALRSLKILTTTMLNAKTQPKLNLGRNTIHVSAGDPLESIVFWPELQNGRYKEHIIEESNITSTTEHPGYMGTLHPKRAGEDACLVYRIDAPQDIKRVNFGGRFYNRAPKSQIDLLYSLDAGIIWDSCWSLTQTTLPWDIIHYENVDIPPGHRSVWLQYRMNTSQPAPSGCSIYAIRIEANYAPTDTVFKPIQVTFDWSEHQKDRSRIQRRHSQTIPKLPFQYIINVGGEDHPTVHSLQVNGAASKSPLKEGYSDGQDVGGDRFLPDWLTLGRNLAIGKPYTLSIPSRTNWDAGDPDGKKLTTGAFGPPYAGGTSYRSGAIWKENESPVITLDLESPMACASFGMNFHGYPWWDALKGEVQDKIEVLTSLDGQQYQSQGFLKTDIRWIDLPANHMWTDEETMTGGTFRLVPPHPVTARFIKYQVTSPRMFDCTGLEVLDSFQTRPFDLRIALPGKIY